MFPGSMISSIMYPSLLIRLNNLLIFSCLQFSAACLLRESRRKPTKRHCRAHVMFHFSVKSLVRLDRRGASWNTRIPWRTHPTGLKTLRCYFCLRAENRCSSSCSKNRYSHSRKRPRHSYSNCCSTAAPHGSHVCLYLFFCFLLQGGGLCCPPLSLPDTCHGWAVKTAPLSRSYGATK